MLSGASRARVGLAQRRPTGVLDDALCAYYSILDYIALNQHILHYVGNGKR